MPRREGEAMVVLARAGVEVASWPLATPGAPDLAVVDALARLQLAARRLGWSIRLRDVCDELRGLLDLVGLADLLVEPLCPLSLEAQREAEGGEQLGVEEVVQPGDPPA